MLGAGGRRSAPAGDDCPRARALREEGSEQGRPSSVRMRVCVVFVGGGVGRKRGTVGDHGGTGV